MISFQKLLSVLWSAKLDQCISGCSALDISRLSTQMCGPYLSIVKRNMFVEIK